MLTPSFELDQNDKYILIKIRAPFAKICETEVEYEDKEFLFSSKPYYLRLYLPKPVRDNDTGTVDYDATQGDFNISVPKLNEGEFFPQLELIGELLKPKKGRKSAAPLIQVLSSDDSDNDCQERKETEKQQSDTNEAEEEEEDFLIDQNVSSLSKEQFSALRLSATHGYGFASLRHRVFSTLDSEICHLIELEKPDSVSIRDRLQMCLEKDQRCFNEDYYLCDLYEPDCGLEASLSYRYSTLSSDDMCRLSTHDNDRLKDLPKKSFQFLSNYQQSSATFTLLELLFAYLYDVRTTQNEHTVESGWTIQKLSGALSFLLSYDCIKDALVVSMRRSLVYPLYRHWDIDMAVFKDLKVVIKSGRFAILKCLLDMHNIFATTGEYRYILNDLYLTDYCHWIQSVSDTFFDKLNSELMEISIEKSDVLLDLETVELSGQMAMISCSQTDLYNATLQDQELIQTADECKRSIAANL